MTLSGNTAAAPGGAETLSTGRWWVFALVGAIFVALGIFVITHLMAATLVSAIFIGASLVVAGGFQIAHAFWERGWAGFIWSLIAGLCYFISGLILLTNPLAGSVALTLFIAAMLVASGVMRLILAYRIRGMATGMLTISGLVGILVGILIFIGWPATGMFVLGAFLGADLFLFGIWWLVFALLLRTSGTAAAS